VSESDQGLIVAAMERVVLALGAKGLVNAQFIVRDDGVYLIEVNPRASRTVPFLSKVTGVPMVELAVRVARGATLEQLGWPAGLDVAVGEVGLRYCIPSGDARLVVNTPTPRSGAIRDAAEIRHAAIAEGVPCLTAIETAVAAAESLDPAIADQVADVRSLQDWLAREAGILAEAELVPAG